MRFGTVVVIFALFFLSGCSTCYYTTGTTDTPNARGLCKGTIVDSLGNPVPNAIVKLIPVSYASGTSDSNQVILSTTTDADGAYSFEANNQGEFFNLCAQHPALNSSMFKDSVRLKNDTAGGAIDTLKKSGSLTFAASPSLGSENAYFCIQGTDFTAQIAPQTNTVQFNNVPAGSLPPVLLVADDNTQDPLCVTKDYAIHSADTTRLTSVLYVCSFHKHKHDNLGDSLFQELLTSQGISVNAVNDSMFTASDTVGMKCIIVSSSVKNSILPQELLSTTSKPVVNLDNVFQVYLGMVGPVRTQDYGQLSGPVATVRRMDSSSSITTGIPDTCSLFGTDSEQVWWGRPSAYGHVVMSTLQDTTKDVVYYYLPGELMDSVAAPGIRFAFIIQNLQVPFITEYGKNLFVNSVQWILGQTP